MRDWTKLLPASFRGVPFRVDADGVSDGRRLARHEAAGGEITQIEDLGRKTPSFSITAYVIGDFADAQALALRQALTVPGPGLLTLPIDGAFMAHVDDVSRSREKDRNGFVGFDITFVPAPAAAGAVLSIGNVSSAVAAGVALAAASLSRLF